VTSDNSAATKTSGSGGDSEPTSLNSGRFYDESSNSILWGTLATVIFSSIGLAVSGFWIAVLEAIIGFQVALINGLAGFVRRVIEAILGGGAGLIVASWQAAAVEAVQAGPAAPILAAIEVIVIVGIAATIWERRPYA